MKMTGITLTLLVIASTFTFAQSQKTVDSILASFDFVRQLENKPAPAFFAKDIFGVKFNSKMFKGHVVLLNVWSTNCSPCIREMDKFNELKGKYKDKKILFIALDHEDNLKRIHTFLKTHKLSFKVLYSPSSNFIKDYGAVGFPANYIIDKNGIIRHSAMGYDEKFGYQLLDSLLTKYM